MTQIEVHPVDAAHIFSLRVELYRAAALLERMESGDVEAAAELQRMCQNRSYVGHVLYVPMDVALAALLEPIHEDDVFVPNPEVVVNEQAQS